MPVEICWCLLEVCHCFIEKLLKLYSLLVTPILTPDSTLDLNSKLQTKIQLLLTQDFTQDLILEPDCWTWVLNLILTRDSNLNLDVRPDLNPKPNLTLTLKPDSQPRSEPITRLLNPNRNPYLDSHFDLYPKTWLSTLIPTWDLIFRNWPWLETRSRLWTEIWSRSVSSQNQESCSGSRSISRSNLKFK